MNIRGLINSVHKTLGRSSLAVRSAIILRNQCRCVIRYHLNEDADPLKNGEAWLASVLAPNSHTFIDVGANIGNWASLFLESMTQKEKGKALLFDPSDYAIHKLKQRFGETEGIKIIQAGVSDSIGEMSFFEEPEGGETSSLVAGFSNPKAVKKLVLITTLDAEVEKHQLEYIDFLKIDTEGYDLHVICGASGLLARQQIGVLQFEYNSPWALAGSTLAAAFNLLSSFNYKVFLLKSDGLFCVNYRLYGEYFDYSNYVAISEQKISELKPFIKGYL